jgi:hypothetical protein
MSILGPPVIERDDLGVTIHTGEATPDDVRQRTISWLNTNGIDDAAVPIVNDFRIQDGVIGYTEWHKNDAGQWIRGTIDGDGTLARYVVTAPVVEPIPPDPWPMP